MVSKKEKYPGRYHALWANENLLNRELSSLTDKDGNPIAQLMAMDMLLDHRGRKVLVELVGVIKKEKEGDKHRRAMEWLTLRFGPQEIAALNENDFYAMHPLTMEGNMTTFKIMNQSQLYMGRLYHDTRKHVSNLEMACLMGARELPSLRTTTERLPQDIRDANIEHIKRVRETARVNRRQSEEEMTEWIDGLLGRRAHTSSECTALLYGDGSKKFAPRLWRILEMADDPDVPEEKKRQIESLLMTRMQFFYKVKDEKSGAESMKVENSTFLIRLIEFDQEAQRIFATWSADNPLFRIKEIYDLHSIYAPPVQNTAVP